MNNLETMSVEALQETLDQTNAQRDELAAYARQVAAVLNKKLALQAAQDKLAGMSDVERLALAQLLQVNGVPSAEKFGKIG